MKLFEIVESKGMQEAVDLIKADCEPFISEGAPRLYRGMDLGRAKQVNSMLHLNRVRKDREPKDSSMWVHKLLNEFFKKHMGVNARSEAAFCSGSKFRADAYANNAFPGDDNAYLILPIGEFEFTWSDKIKDAYEVFEEEWYQSPGREIGQALKKAADALGVSSDDMEMPDDELKYKIIKKFLEDDGEDFYYFSKNLQEAAKSGNEIMLDCDKYYVLNNTDPKFVQELMEKIRA